MQQPQTASALAPLGGEDPSDACSMKKLFEPDVDSVGEEDVATEDDGDEGPPVKCSRLSAEDLEKRALDFHVWGERYFEQQQGAFCGRHAPNNLLGRPQFTDEDLLTACTTVCAITGEAPADHCAPSGWYSHSVLATVLDQTAPPVGHLIVNQAEPGDYHLVVACDDYYGFLVNLENQHWARIAKLEACLWYVDSRFAPTMVDVEDSQSIIALYPTTFLFQKNEAVFA